MNRVVLLVVGTLIAAPVWAQTAASTARAEAEARQSRYQIGQMERLLEGAVEHGVTLIRDRFQKLTQTPAELLVTDNAHARGFRLDGYGVFFDVTAPSFETSALVWSLRTLDQNDLGVDSALKTLQDRVKGDPSAEQALKRLEIQVGPVAVARVANPAVAGARNATGSVAATSLDQPPADTAVPANPLSPNDPILADPNEAYRTEVILALKDAMLDHSTALGIGPDEWLTIAVRGNDDRPRLAPADSDARTRVIRLRGADLAAYLARQITRDEALQRIEVRVF
ncbi:MAG TPA: hypothetical protein VFA27_14140 [Vicinamibacterales bacterium]|nr:hypothetical protein [Vicinamibacterales bacterium]